MDLKDVRDFFNYPDWYRHVYNQLEDGDIFIEIGTWTGASAIFFGNLIKGGDKKINFYTIDTFEGDKNLEKYYGIIQDGKLYEHVVKKLGFLGAYIHIIRGDSQIKETSDIFHDESVAAIFIDGDHSHEGVRKDLHNWYPKIKSGGIISGHDYIWGGIGVKPIVDTFSESKATLFPGKSDVWHYMK